MQVSHGVELNSGHVTPPDGPGLEETVQGDVVFRHYLRIRIEQPHLRYAGHDERRRAVGWRTCRYCVAESMNSVRRVCTSQHQVAARQRHLLLHQHTGPAQSVDIAVIEGHELRDRGLAAIAKFEPTESLNGSVGLAKVSLDGLEALWKHGRAPERRSDNFKSTRRHCSKAEERHARHEAIPAAFIRNNVAGSCVRGPTLRRREAETAKGECSSQQAAAR